MSIETIAGPLLGWALRLFVIWLAFDLARKAFAETQTPRKTSLRAVGWVVGIAAVAGALKGYGSDEPCDPNPFGGGCSTHWEALPVSERVSTATFFLALIGVPVALGAVVGTRKAQAAR